MLLLFLNANARDISFVLCPLCLSLPYPPSLSLFIVHYEQRKKYAKYAIYIYVRFRQLYSPSLYLTLSLSLPLCLAALL